MAPIPQETTSLLNHESPSCHDENLEVWQERQKQQQQSKDAFICTKRCSVVLGVLAVVSLVGFLLLQTQPGFTDHDISHLRNESGNKEIIVVLNATMNSSTKPGETRLPMHRTKPPPTYNITRGNNATPVLPDVEVVEKALGPYQLIELQRGQAFWDAYDFFNGTDSAGSAGYQVYVSENRSKELGIAYTADDEQSVVLKSAFQEGGYRESTRLEGKERYEHGLFIMDVEHMPYGCGVWPAFWMTDEEAWPDHGEIDIVEGINTQTKAKTALHTRSTCNQYAHVSSNWMTGTWDRATGIPDRFTGVKDVITNVPADNCWSKAPHQWFNQGCVIVDDKEGSLGGPVNEQGGAVYALEWDPAKGHIKSWSFPRDIVPDNLVRAMASAPLKTTGKMIRPDPDSWGPPYACFVIGERSGCSADHFQNMHIVVNLAFCGQVAGNRFGRDCPALFGKFSTLANTTDPIEACNAYLKSRPEEVEEEAYWKIRGIYTFQREMVTVNTTAETIGN